MNLMELNYTPLPKKKPITLLMFLIEFIVLIGLVAFFYSKFQANKAESIMEISSPTQHTKAKPVLGLIGKITSWKTFTNTLYGYSIQYPPATNILAAKKEEVVILFDKSGIPSNPEIKDFDLTNDFDKALVALFNKYTDKACIKIEYKLGYIYISSKNNNQNRVFTCSEYGLRKNIKINQESVVVGKKTLVAAGAIIDNAQGNNLYYQQEYFHIDLPDGNSIEYGTLPVSDKNAPFTFNDYLKIKKELLQILQSYKTI